MSALVDLPFAPAGQRDGSHADERGWADRFSLIKNSGAASAIFFLYVALDYTDFPLPFLQAGGISVYVKDGLIVAIGVATVARLLRARRMTTLQRVLLALLALALLSLVRGVLTIGVATAVNESREWLLFLMSSLYFCMGAQTEAKEVVDRIGKHLLWAATAVAGVALIRWAVLGTGLPLGGMFTNPEAGIRVMPSSPTVVIAQGFFLLAPALVGDHKVRKWWAVSLLAVAVLMQHRTVWGVILVGLFALTYRRPSLGRRFTVALLVSAVVGSFLAVTVLGGGSSELEDRATNADTFEWRLTGWQELVRKPEGLVEIAVGQPFGSGWTREVYGLTREESPHSLYVEAYLRFGLVGLALLVYLLGTVCLRFFNAPRGGARETQFMSNDLVFLLTLSVVVFSVTYSNPLSAGPIVGIALARYIEQGQRVQPAPAPSVPGTTH